jgi:hypothetical protein
MSWINGAAAARGDMARDAMSTSPHRSREEAIRDMRDSAAACRGTGTGGWSDGDIDEYVDECNRELRGR